MSKRGLAIIDGIKTHSLRKLKGVFPQLKDLRRKGKSRDKWVMLCPFHAEKTDSFVWNERKKTWRCYGCSQHGNIIGFTTRMLGVKKPATHPRNLFPEAVSLLSRIFKIDYRSGRP